MTRAPTYADKLGVTIPQLTEVGVRKLCLPPRCSRRQSSNLTAGLATNWRGFAAPQGRWHDVEQTVGVFINATALAVVAWLTDVSSASRYVSRAATDGHDLECRVGQHQGRHGGLGDNLVSVIIPSPGLALAAAAAFGVGQCGFAATAGRWRFSPASSATGRGISGPISKRAMSRRMSLPLRRVCGSRSIDGFDKLRQGQSAPVRRPRTVAATDLGVRTNSGLWSVKSRRWS
jgi:hypothetical protein